MGSLTPGLWTGGWTELWTEVVAQVQFELGASGLQGQAHGAAGGQAAAEAINQATQHGFEPGWIAEHRRQAGFNLQLQHEIPPGQLPLPERLQLPEQFAQISAGQGIAFQGLFTAGLALELGGQKDQAKAINLLTAFAIDLLEPLAGNGG